MTDVLPSTDELNAVVLAVAGVDGLFAVAPLSAVLGTVRDALTHRPPAPHSVSVVAHGTALSVAVKIGVADGYAAADVCRRVHDALLNHLTHHVTNHGTAAGTPEVAEVAEIAVTVARIG